MPKHETTYVTMSSPMARYAARFNMRPAAPWPVHTGDS